MRVSPIGLYFSKIDEVKYETTRATIPSHCHKEAINGAVAVASAIFLLKQGKSKEDVFKYIESNYYSLKYSLDDLQRNNTFSSKAVDSVPIALFCFFKSNSFEDAIRISLSVGGDSDTICSIVGSLSEVHYGLDETLYEQVKPLIPDYMLEIINKFYKNKVRKNSKR